MPRSTNPADTDLSVLSGRTVAVIGFGNQGCAQALNLRDSGCTVIVGNIADRESIEAQSLGFEVRSISDAAGAGDIVMVLLPDEIQRSVYLESIEPGLSSGKTLCFAHGYNIRYGHIEPPDEVDVILVAPRMIGSEVRRMYVEGEGAAVFVAVHRDASGRAEATALALAAGLGATSRDVLRTTFGEETELDLFSEQALWPVIWLAFESAFELLTERGYDPEAVLLELYRSGEPSRVLAKAAEEGLYRQLRLHSRTSQYGTLSRKDRLGKDFLRGAMARALDEIQSGAFAREWADEERASFPAFNALKDEALAHPINEIEGRMSETDLNKPIEAHDGS